jgi:drug/metabolite transporter (DMT)-like permease
VATRWSRLGTLTPWDLAALRFGVAGPLLLPIVVRHGLGHAAGIGWGRAVVLAIVAGAPYTLILYAGLALAPAGHGAVIITGATPVVSTLLVWFWLGDRPSATRRCGLPLFQGLYQGVGVAIAALALYAWAIRVLGASVASLFMPLVPVFGVLLAVPVLGEISTSVQRVGIVAVSLGMVLAAGVAARSKS